MTYETPDTYGRVLFGSQSDLEKRVGFIPTMLIVGNIVLTACGKDSPISPTPPGPPPVPSQKSSITIPFEPIHGSMASSSKVYIDGVDRGAFQGNTLTLSDVEAGTRRLKISGDLEREVDIVVEAGSENKYEPTKALDTNAVSSDLMRRFDRAARPGYIGGIGGGIGERPKYEDGIIKPLLDENTGRFTGAYYLDVSSMRIVRPDLVNYHITNIEDGVKMAAPQVYGSAMQGIPLIYVCPSGSVGGLRCDTNTFPPDGTENAYTLQFLPSLPVGALNYSYVKNNVPYKGKIVHNVIYGGKLQINPDVGRGIIQDILNLLGIVDEWQDTLGGPKNSIFNEHMISENPTQLDEILGKTFMGMLPGSRRVFNTSDFEKLIPREVVAQSQGTHSFGFTQPSTTYTQSK